jgi:ABC-type dipeptide/oligopeptide/nickel transport system ATPase component
VMNQGLIIETGDTEALWADPQQQYTRDLLAAIPMADPKSERLRTTR